MNQRHLSPGESRHIGDRTPVGTRRTLMGFDWCDCWQAYPQLPFKPRGLLIWGLTGGETVSAQIAMNHQLAVSSASIPARFFAQGDSFEQVAKLIEQGKETLNWCDWDRVLPGCVARLYLLSRTREPLGPAHGIELVMWGETPIL